MSVTEPTVTFNLDFKQQKSFVSWYNNLPQKPISTVRFFNHADFYTLHSEDAAMASEFTGNILKYMGEEPTLSYVVLRKTQFEQFIRELLLIRQYRVEVYVRAAANKVNDWDLEYKGSPGNLAQFEEVLFDNAEISFSNYVMGIKIVKGKVVAVACVNSTELKFQLCELTDNDSFTDLEALIAQIGPKECIIPSGESPDLINLRKVLERNSVLVARVKRSDFNPNDVLQDLNRLLFFAEGQHRNATSLAETQLSEALGCLSAVIKFLNLTADEQNFNQFKINTVDVHRYVRLDNAALYSLNILPKPGRNTTWDNLSGASSNKSFSVKGVLDACVTNQGKRLLEQWIKQPLKDFNVINERLDIVERFFKDTQARETIRSDKLTRLGDLLVLSKKLSSQKASLQDCYRIYQIVKAVPNLIKVLKETRNAGVKSALIDPLVEIKNDLTKYEEMIEEMLNLELVDRGEFLINKDFDPELAEVCESKERVEEKMQKVLRKAAEELDFEEKNIRLECNDQYGYFFRVTLKEEHALRTNKKFRILDAIKGGVRFTNDKLDGLNSEYGEIKAEYEEKQKRVLVEMFKVAASYGECLRNLNLYIATVDVLVSFAHVSISAQLPYCKPLLHKSGTGVLKLNKLRHPCIEQHVSFIPNGVEFDRGKNFHIITGPNMCGKSTFIRSVGICVLMAQIGCFVPCESAEISVVDAILSRVGAEDCELKGLSTFMLEMIETSTITKTATAESLVIIDELGRGTSTYDGCGIAYAVAEHLAKEIKCLSLFATHFHEITRLAEECPSVNNFHVTAAITDETVIPLYQVKPGPCDHSYGIHCAKMADFPDDVIEDALKYQKELEHSEGVHLINDYEETLKRDIIKDGDEIIKNYLEQLENLDVNKLTDEQLQEEMRRMKDEIDATGNLFVKGLLSQ